MEKTDVSQRRGSSVSRPSSKCTVNSSAISTLPAYPADMDLPVCTIIWASFLKLISFIYLTYMCIYIYMYTYPHTHTHIPYWFPFSGELWLIQLLMQEFCKTKNVCKSIGYVEFAINSIVYLKIVSYMPHILNMSNIYYKHIYICMHTLFSQRFRCSLFSSKPKIKVCISFFNQIVSVCEVCYKFRAVWFSCFLKWFSKYF